MMPSHVPLANGRAQHAKPGGTGRYQHRDAQIAGSLFVGTLLIYAAVSRYKYVAYDAASMVGLAHTLVNHLSLNAGQGFDDYLHLSTPYSPYGIGLSLVIAPIYGLSKLTGHENILLSFINPCIMSMTVVVSYAIGRALRWGASWAVLCAATFGILTMALQATTELFSEPAVALCVAVLIWAILRWSAGWKYAPIVIGLTAGAVIQFRADSILTVWIGLLAVPLFVPWRQVMRIPVLVAVGIPTTISLCLLGAYNNLRWHSPLVFSYNGEGFQIPLGRGLEGLLFSPGKSFFLYNPIAILGVIGIVTLLWTRKPVGVLFLLLIIPRFIFFAKWESWEGGVDWGPRFLFPIVLLFVIGAVDVLVQTRRRSLIAVCARVAFVGLALFGLGVNYLSVRVPYEQWYSVVASPSLSSAFDGGKPFVSNPTAVGAVGNAYDFTYRASQIRGDLDLLESHRAQDALVVFVAHPRLAWAMLSAGSGFLLLAAIAAFDLDWTLKRKGQSEVESPELSDTV